MGSVMKKFVLFSISCFFLLGLWACSQPRGTSSAKQWMEPGGRIRVLATTAQLGDLAKEIGGERASVLVLIRGDLNPHSYTLVKGDGEKLARADLVLSNGLGLEHGASLAAALESHPRDLPLGDWIRAHYPEEILHAKGEIDPHIWMDISLWAKGIDPIVEKLSELDPEGASLYLERGEALRVKMETTHQELFRLLQKIPEEKRYLVTSHDAFQYFTRGYLRGSKADWDQRFAAPEGLAPEGQLTPFDLQEILSFLQKNKIRVLFPESNVHPDSIRKISSAAQELGFSVRVCERALYGDAMGGFSYLEAMERNGQLLAEELSK